MTPELDILMKVTMVLVLGLIATRLAARARASVRSLLLASTLGALIALPLAAALAPDLVVAIQLPQAPGAAPANAGASARAQAPVRAEGLVSSAAASFDGARAEWQDSTGMSVPAALRLLWAAGALLLLAFLANALRQVRAVRRSGIPWLAGQTAAQALARESGIRRRLTLILHEDVPAPVTFGWSRPTIALPMDAREWSESDLRRAFVHELEHVRRGDWPMQLAARAICAGYWFHPLVWVAWRQLCLESERACDDAVVNRAEQADYAEQLLILAERLARSQAQPVLSMANRSDLSVRVRAVLDRTQLRGRAGVSLVAATVAAASVFVLAVAPVRVQAVPDQRANTGGRRATGSDVERASTRALNVALVEAAQKGDVDEVTALLNEGVDVNAVVRGDGTALLVAARHGRRDIVRLLLDRGADANIGVEGDGNPLIMAASRGHRDIVTMLLDRGADVNAAVPGDGNALITASGAGYLDVVRLLVGRGANVNARVWAEQGWPDRQGEWRTPLSMARRGGHASVVKYLQSVGAIE